MSYYENVYKKRLNRYGLDYQSRIKTQREKNFQNYLLRVTTRVNFTIGEETYVGSLERFKQDETQTLCHLLTDLDTDLANGTIVLISGEDPSSAAEYYMILWQEEVQNRGYNKYIVLKMTRKIEWIEDGVACAQWAFYEGPGLKAVRDAIKSASTNAIYTENNNLSFVITPLNQHLKKDTYFQLEEQGISSGFRVTEIDVYSTPGVAYVSVDPVKIRDNTPAPVQTPEDNANDFYWLNGGK